MSRTTLEQIRERARNDGDDAFLSLVDAVEALVETGWRDSDGRCWCDRATEASNLPHEPKCKAARKALEELGLDIRSC